MDRESFLSDIYNEYEKGISFKNSIDLYKTVNESERLFSGDQWAGLKENNMPKPVFNIIKRIIQYKIASIKANPTAIIVAGDSPKDEQLSKASTVLTSYIKTLWERLKMDSKNYSGLKDAALSGDYILYFYWDTMLKTATPFLGDINSEIIDNVNYFPGNPNCTDVQKQPYIILAFRELTKNLIKEAKLNNRPTEDIDFITPDEDTLNQSGDISKIELEGSQKTICLLKLWREDDGNIYSTKVTKNAIIKDRTNTLLTRYPIAMMNWEERKNCCHGISEVFGLKPNQLFINKAFAQAMLNTMLFSFPKMIYDNSRIKKPSNTIGGAISVNGNIEGAVKYLTPPSMSSDLFRLLDVTIAQTKELMGANDVALGNVKSVDNTSAFMAVREATAVPLEGVRLRFYQMVEDMGRIILDFITSYYIKGRKISYTNEDGVNNTTLNYSELKEKITNLRVDVGPSSEMTELMCVNTLDKLLAAEKISFGQYLERIPDGYIPSKQKLIEEVNGG